MIDAGAIQKTERKRAMNRNSEGRSNSKSVLFRTFLILLLAASPLLAKTDVDFDPNVDFSKYKTFAFIGPVPNMVMLEVSPDLIDQHVHESVKRALTKKGLREVQPDQNPDLVVRYWASTSQQVNLAVMGQWAPYNPFVGSYWGPMYDAASKSKEGNSLITDLIDPRTRSLVWRLYVTRKLTNADKDWNKADEELTKGFDNFPPSEREKDAKRKERAAHPPKTD
jgi:Domain of unknown function (DUF4136)